MSRLAPLGGLAFVLMLVLCGCTAPQQQQQQQPSPAPRDSLPGAQLGRSQRQLQATLPVTELTFSNDTVYDCNGAASAMTIRTGGVTVRNVTFKNCIDTAVWVLNTGYIGNVTFNSCKWLNNRGISGGAVHLSNVTDNSLTTSSLTSRITVSFVNCTFTSNYVSGSTSLSTLSSTLTTFELGGGAVAVGYADNTTGSSVPSSIMPYSLVEFVSCTFTNNSADTRGGAVYAYGSSGSKSSVLFSSCKFVSNTAPQGAAVSVGNYSLLTSMSGCTLTGNTVVTHGTTGVVTCGAMCVDFIGAAIAVSSSTFTGNGGDACAIGGALAVMDIPSNSQQVAITQSTFTGNLAGNGGALYLTGSLGQAAVSYCTFESNVAFAPEGSGGAIALISLTPVTVSSCTFTSNSATGTGSWGGALSTFRVITTLVENCTFTYNWAGQGGAVAQAQYGSLTVANSSLALNNATYGGALSGGRDSDVSVTESTFTSNSGLFGGAILCLQCNTAVLDSCTFDSNSANTAGAVGFMYVYSASTISKCYFYNNNADTDSQDRYYIPSLNGNSAGAGGGIVAVMSQTLTVTNTTFKAGRATFGGGLYLALDCSATADFTCSEATLSIDADSSFVDNAAVGGNGGAVFAVEASALSFSCPDGSTYSLTDFDIVIALQASTPISMPAAGCSSWTGNTASAGGAVLASPMYQVKLLYSSIDGQAYNSGDNVQFLFELQDLWGQVIGPGGADTNGTTMYMTVTSYTYASSVSNTTMTTPSIVGQSSQRSALGNVQFNTTQLLSPPGNVTVTLTVSSNVTSTGTGLSTVLPTLLFDVRACLYGEVTNSLGDLCTSCATGYYSFNPSNTSCDSCPDNAQCSQQIVVPALGYWHSTPWSRQIHKCAAAKACTYDNRTDILEALYATISTYVDPTTNFSVQGPVCNTGHTGNLCGKCMPGYGHSSDGLCGACRSVAVNSIYYLLTYLLSAVFVMMLIRSALSKGATSEQVDVILARGGDSGDGKAATKGTGKKGPGAASRPSPLATAPAAGVAEKASFSAATSPSRSVGAGGSFGGGSSGRERAVERKAGGSTLERQRSEGSSGPGSRTASVDRLRDDDTGRPASSIVRTPQPAEQEAAAAAATATEVVIVPPPGEVTADGEGKEGAPQPAAVDMLRVLSGMSPGAGGGGAADDVEKDAEEDGYFRTEKSDAAAPTRQAAEVPGLVLRRGSTKEAAAARQPSRGGAEQRAESVSAAGSGAWGRSSVRAAPPELEASEGDASPVQRMLSNGAAGRGQGGAASPRQMRGAGGPVGEAVEAWGPLAESTEPEPGEAGGGYKGAVSGPDTPPVAQAGSPFGKGQQQQQQADSNLGAKVHRQAEDEGDEEEGDSVDGGEGDGKAATREAGAKPGAGGGGGGGASHGKPPYSVVLKILVSYVQVTTLLAKIIEQSDNTLYSQFLSVLGQASSAVGTIVSLECSLSDSSPIARALQVVIITILIPAIFILLAVPIWLLLWANGKRAAAAARRALDAPSSSSLAGSALSPPAEAANGRGSGSGGGSGHLEPASSSEEEAAATKAADPAALDPGPLLAYLDLRMIITCLSVIFLMYPTTSSAILSLFQCQTLDTDTSPYAEYAIAKHSVSSLDYTLLCYTGYHSLALAVLGVPGAVFFAFGIPLAAAGFLRMSNRRGLLRDETFVMKYGFLYEDYSHRCYAWESVILGRKLFLTLAYVFLSPIDTALELLVMLAVMVIAWALQLSYRPYGIARFNRLEALSLCVTSATYFLAAVFLTSSTSVAYTAATKLGVGIILIVLTCAFMAHLLRALLIEVYNFAVEQLDVDKDGKVTPDEVVAYLRLRLGAAAPAVLWCLRLFGKRFAELGSTAPGAVHPEKEGKAGSTPEQEDDGEGAGKAQGAKAGGAGAGVAGSSERGEDKGKGVTGPPAPELPAAPGKASVPHLEAPLRVESLDGRATPSGGQGRKAAR